MCTLISDNTRSPHFHLLIRHFEQNRHEKMCKNTFLYSKKHCKNISPPSVKLLQNNKMGSQESPFAHFEIHNIYILQYHINKRSLIFALVPVFRSSSLFQGGVDNFGLNKYGKHNGMSMLNLKLMMVEEEETNNKQD